jgi:hypothetical protein
VAVAAVEKENDKTEAETSTPDKVESVCDAEVNVPTNSVAVSVQELQDKTEEKEKKAEQEKKSNVLTLNEEEEGKEEEEEEQQEQEEKKTKKKKKKEGEEEKKDGGEKEKPSEPDSSKSECTPAPAFKSSSPKPDQSEGNKTEAMEVCSDVDGDDGEQENDGKVSYF